MARHVARAQTLACSRQIRDDESLADFAERLLSPEGQEAYEYICRVDAARRLAADILTDMLGADSHRQAQLAAILTAVANGLDDNP